MTQVNADNALAIYRVGPVLCCAPTRTVTAIIEPPANLTHPPGSTASSPGIFAFNKKVVAVTDLRYRFGVPESNWKHPGRMIIVDQDDESRGYWVDDIIDVVEMPTSGWQALPPHLPRGIFKSTLLIKDKILLYAEFDKLAKITGSGYLREYIEALYEQHSSKLQASIASANSSVTKKQSGTASENKDASKTKSTSPSAASSITRLPATGNPDTKNNKGESAAAIQQGATLHSEHKKLTTSASNTATDPASDKKVSDNVVPFKHASKLANRSTSTTTAIESADKKDTPPDPIKKPLHANTVKQSITKDIRSENTDPTPTKKTTVQRDVYTPQHSAPAKSPGQDEIPQQRINRHSTSSVSPAPASSSGNTTSHLQKDDDASSTRGSGKPFLFVLSLIILLCAAAGFYYLRNDVTDNRNNTPVSSYTPAPIIIPALTRGEQGDETSTANNSHGMNKESVESIPQQTEIQSKKSGIADAGEHQASIEHDEQGIAIVLTSPQKPEFKTPKQNINTQHATNAVATAPGTKNPPDKFLLYSLPEAISLGVPSLQKPSKIKYEFTHVVVKGDTLWHIAIRYLHDPYRYPELAQLSKIKNPDRIYPGNNIRIIYQSQ